MASTTVGHVTLAGVGSAKGAPFSPAQLQHLQDSRPAIASSPATQSLMAGRALYVGTPGKVDGSYQGSLGSVASNEIGQQRDFGAALRELLTAVGVAL